MDGPETPLEEEVLALYREPVIGATYTNTYGEENIKNLVDKYHGLNENRMKEMLELVVRYSQSQDLGSSFISVGVLHALGRRQEVEEAYRWAGGQEDEKSITSHFDIGISIAEHFAHK
ncbi:MAG: hypothetical protein V3U37_06035 [Nitrospinaceae bacterium]